MPSATTGNARQGREMVPHAPPPTSAWSRAQAPSDQRCPPSGDDRSPDWRIGLARRIGSARPVRRGWQSLPLVLVHCGGASRRDAPRSPTDTRGEALGRSTDRSRKGGIVPVCATTLSRSRAVGRESTSPDRLGGVALAPSVVTAQPHRGGAGPRDQARTTPALRAPQGDEATRTPRSASAFQADW